MADLTIPPITLAPRVPKGPKFITITTNAGVTVFITDEVTLWHNFTETVSILDTSFIHVTTTITDTITTTQPTTTTIIKTQTITPTPTTPLVPFIRPTIDSNSRSTTSLLPLPTTTYSFCSTVPTRVPVAKHIDPFQVLSIVFGVFILFLLALMWFLVRRFYKMYRAERVLRKQLQTEGTEMPGTEMPGMGMGVVKGGDAEGKFAVGEE